MILNTLLISSFPALFLLFAQYAMATPQSESMLLSLPLQAGVFEHIQFGKIKANRFVFKNQEMRIDVDESASFLMFPFDEVKIISEIRFQWRSQGELLVKSAQHEQQRDGDDAVFKLGLLIKSSEVLFNPMAPSWLKRVTRALKFPSEKIIDLVADSKHVVGERWMSPYNDNVTMISVKSIPLKTGWQQAVHKFKSPIEVVAIWLMADGDNTHSSFTTRVKNIEIR